MFKRLEKATSKLTAIPNTIESSPHYTIIKRNIFGLILIAFIILTFALETLNYYHYRNAVKNKIFSDFEMITNKFRHSLELYFKEKVAIAKFITSVYTYNDLSQPDLLNKIHDIIQKEYGDGVLGMELVDSEGNRIAFAGLHDIGRRNYKEQYWFRELQTDGSYVGEAFTEDYKYSYFIVAVAKQDESGKWLVFMMNLDANHLGEILNSAESNLEVFFIDSRGICKTDSRTLCKVQEPCQIGSLPVSYDPITITARDYYVSYVYLPRPHYALVIARKQKEVLSAWLFFRERLFSVFLVNLVITVVVAYKLSSILIKRITEFYKKRELALKEMRYSDRLTSISRLASGVAHEINNPLSIINENAGLMKDLLLFHESFPERKRFVNLIDSILEAVNRCREITHKMLEFAGSTDINVEILDLNDVIKEVLKNLEDEATRLNISIIPNLAKDLPAIYSDKKHLRDVFLNILRNAFEAIDNGGEVYVTTWEFDKDTVAVTIKDTGRGMSEEVMAQIFEPFFSAKKTYSTGLGLTVTYGIVKKLGGDIKVESREGEGATFTVYLPKKSLSTTVKEVYK